MFAGIILQMTGRGLFHPPSEDAVNSRYVVNEVADGPRPTPIRDPKRGNWLPGFKRLIRG